MLIPFEEMPAHSRVWIYQSDRPFSQGEAETVKQALLDFIPQWTAHNHQLKASGTLLYNRFIVIAVDETQAGASGCSIDKSVRLMQDLEKQLGISLFDRLRICYLDNDQVKDFPLAELEALYKQGTVTAGTLIFNNLVKDKKEMSEKWLQSISDSWMSGRLAVNS